VRNLLQKGANINGRNRDGWTPLLAAASNGLLRVRELLKDDRINVNDRLRSPGGPTALTLASIWGHATVVCELLRGPLGYRVNMNVTSIGGRTALIMASSRGHADIVRELVLQTDLNVNAKDNKYGNTALILASTDGHVAVVRLLLLLYKVDVNAKNNLEYTALSIASNRGQVAIVRELLLQPERVDVNTKNYANDTALLMASSFGHVTALQTLPLPGGRHVGDDENAGFILKHVRRREAVVLELLKDDRVDVNARDLEGRVAFAWASYHNNLVLIHAFLKRKDVDVNATGTHGNTLLMWACFRGQSDLVVELLQHAKVDVHAKNKAGSTALDIANGLDMFEIARCLVEHTKGRINRKRSLSCVLEKSELFEWMLDIENQAYGFHVLMVCCNSATPCFFNMESRIPDWPSLVSMNRYGWLQKKKNYRSPRRCSTKLYH
jgi:ankyrin repeat protein